MLNKLFYIKFLNIKIKFIECYRIYNIQQPNKKGTKRHHMILERKKRFLGLEREHCFHQLIFIKQFPISINIFQKKDFFFLENDLSFKKQFIKLH